MLAWSVKSVPGSLVLMVPSLIGVPVAATPGLGPHDEVFVLAAPLLLVVVALDELDAAPLAALLLLELLLLPHPASAISTATTAGRMIHDLAGDLLCVFTVSLSSL